MSPTMLALSPTRTAEDPEELVIIDNVEDYTAATSQGCGNDNPYN